jgi:hypothetical protein
MARDDDIKSEKFQMRMRPSVKSAGTQSAKERNMSLNALLEWLLIEHLKGEGRWPPTENGHSKAKKKQR